MNLAWTKHLKDPEEKQKFEKDLIHSQNVLHRLLQLLDEEENSLNRSETDIKTFDSPNWAYLQAYKNGYRACLKIIKKLVDLDQEKGK